jgi:predicted anti-sigma-YlaC factor YlaD
MTCKEVGDLIEPIVAGDLEPSPDVRAHLESCPSCALMLATARRLEAALAAHRPPSVPDRFVANVLQRIRRERWRMEQSVDFLFNAAIVVALLIVGVGIFALMNVSGVVAASSVAWAQISEISSEMARQMAPAMNTYIAAAGLLLTALIMWWWAERIPFDRF